MYCFSFFYFSTRACAVTVLNFVDKGTQTSSTALEGIVAHSNRGTHTHIPRPKDDTQASRKHIELRQCTHGRTRSLRNAPVRRVKNQLTMKTVGQLITDFHDYPSRRHLTSSDPSLFSPLFVLRLYSNTSWCFLVCFFSFILFS